MESDQNLRQKIRIHAILKQDPVELVVDVIEMKSRIRVRTRGCIKT